MTAKRKKGGRVTPKGTKNPTKTSKARRDVPSTSTESVPHDHAGNPAQPGKQSGKVARPLTHNRGNR